jgi:hypothetical protein
MQLIDNQIIRIIILDFTNSTHKYWYLIFLRFIQKKSQPLKYSTVLLFGLQVENNEKCWSNVISTFRFLYQRFPSNYVSISLTTKNYDDG